MSHKPKQVFREGAINPQFICDSIARHSSKTEIGAHSIFLGQVRNDVIDSKKVIAIDYSAYNDMAEEIFHHIREDAFQKYSLTCMHIYHSLGRVMTGEISLFVFTSAPHRAAAIEACTYIVERIKKEAPVWGREIFDDESFDWKKSNNTI